MIASGSFAFIAYLSGNALFADYLQIHHVWVQVSWQSYVVP